MSTVITRAPDLRRAPWRNGRGLTTEIAISGSPDDFIWRVSVADVQQSGDFSVFPGIDRTIALIEGGSMTLHLPDRLHVLRPDQPFAFDGDLAVRCTVERPTRDLNVMTRRTAAEADLAIHQLATADMPVVVPGAGVVVLVVLEGTADLGTTPGAALGTGDAAVVTDTVDMALTGSGRVAVTRIRLS